MFAVELIQSVLLIISAILMIISAIGFLTLDKNMNNLIYARIHIVGVFDVDVYKRQLEYFLCLCYCQMHNKLRLNTHKLIFLVIQPVSFFSFFPPVYFLIFNLF